MQVFMMRSSALTSTCKFFTRSVTASPAQKVYTNDEVPVKSWTDIPGPSSLPLIGSLHHFLPGGYLYNLGCADMVSKMYKSYGPIIRVDIKPPLIFVCDPESSSQILRGENFLPIRPGMETLAYHRKYFKKSVKEDSPTSLITDQGEIWKQLRYAVNPVLMAPKNIRLYTSVLDEIATDMITRMKSQRDHKNMIRWNFNQEMKLWAFESVAVIALGSRIGCLDSSLPENSPATQLVSNLYELYVLVEKLDFKPSIWKLVATPNFKRVMQLYDLHDSLSKHFIKQSMEEIKTKGKAADEKGVLGKLMDINEDFAYIMAADMLISGVDTASNTMTGVLYLLAANPDIQNKLREELRSSKGKRPYLKACLKEALRVMPVVAATSRITTKDYNIMGYRIPAGKTVIFAHQNMGLMEEQYPRANEFLPERWLVEKDDPLHYGHAHPFAYNPFGFGVRSCIGRRIMELEMELFTTRLVENFQIEWFGPPPRIQAGSVNHITGPYNFIFNNVPK